jgi:hypothetical protein
MYNFDRLMLFEITLLIFIRIKHYIIILEEQFCGLRLLINKEKLIVSSLLKI